MLNFTFLGTSSGVPTCERNVTGLAVQAVPAGGGAGWFLIDAGEGTQQQLQRTKLSLHELAAVCASPMSTATTATACRGCWPASAWPGAPSR